MLHSVTKKRPTWLFVLLILILFLAILFSVGQALTFSWLSAFPERASQLRSLEVKFWVYVILAIVLAVAEVLLIMRLIRQVRQRS